MNRIRSFMQKHALTTGEKALAVMFIAGILGLWAGSNVSAPSEAAGLTAAVAMLPAQIPMADRQDVPAQRAKVKTLDRRYLPAQYVENATEFVPEPPPIF